MKQKIKDSLYVILGTALMTVAVNLIYEPMGMVTGGFSGLGILLHEVTRGFHGGVPVWLVNIGLNVPLFFLAYRRLGKEYLGKTIGATLLFSLFLWLIPVLPVKQEDFLTAALVGGVLSGGGLGLVYAGGASTGGSDLCGKLLSLRFRQYSAAKCIMGVDAAIVLLGTVVFGPQAALYAVIAVYVSGKVMDMILEGLHFSKAAFIISEKYPEIVDCIHKSMDRGATLLPAVGTYQDKEERIILCVVAKKEISSLIRQIKTIDDCAFLIILDAKEVYGEGFMQEM